MSAVSTAPVTELGRILALRRQAEAAGRWSVLAHLVSAAGSSYRRPGARFLVTQDGETAGAISGGCLEGDLAVRAKSAAAGGRACIVPYDMGDAAAWGLRAGCGGALEILLDPLAVPGRREALEVLAAAAEGAGAAAAAVALDGGSRTGAQLVLDAAGRLSGDLCGTSAEPELVRRLRAARETPRGSAVARIGRRPGEFRIESVLPCPVLFVCGAGADAVPLVSLARQIGWQAEVVVVRASDSARRRFAELLPGGLSSPGDLSRLPPGRAAAAVVMTHNLDDDRELLEAALASRADYVAVLGPRERTRRVAGDLAGDPRLHAPAGLDIGSETPEEIALAILAEASARLAGRAGGSLRDREGAMHPRDDEAVRPIFLSRGSRAS